MIKKKKVSKLYDYIFHFNPLTGKNGMWAAIPRDSQKDYFNNMTNRINTKVLYSEDITTLLDFLK